MTCSGRWLRTCVAYVGFVFLLKFLPLGAKVRVGVEHKLLVTWVLWFCVTMCETVRRHIEYYCSKGGCCVEYYGHMFRRCIY
jgi:hypothetical protein